MKTQLFQNKLSVKKSLIHGYGVFAEADIHAGDIVEECHAILTESQDRVLIDYLFAADGVRSALLMGFGGIYNHSEEPNLGYIFDEENCLIIFKAKRDIQMGEELLISYGKDWFSGRALPIKKMPFWRKFFLPKHSFLSRALIAVGVCFLGAYGFSLIIRQIT